jgi:hypothetical protein
VCNIECDNDACNFDDGDCIVFCAPGCPPHWLLDDNCDPSCYTAECNYDNGACDTNVCSAGCAKYKLGNGQVFNHTIAIN